MKRAAMLWLRGVIFTVLVPAVIAFFIPAGLDPAAKGRGGAWDLGYLFIVIGAALYLLCLLRFLSAGGTPAIFFTRQLRHLIGEEPARLVSSGLYQYSRNPMYVGVLLVIFGQAILFASLFWAAYGLTVFLLFHLVVVFVEEPHLRKARGASYEEYCRSVPRWLGLRTFSRSRP